MITLNNIIEEIKEVPEDKLEELYEYVHSLTPKTKSNEENRKRTMSFAGAFSDMADNEYADYLHQTKETRRTLFDRNVEL